MLDITKMEGAHDLVLTTFGLGVLIGPAGSWADTR